MRLDYADWLTPERLVIEEELWARDKHYERYAKAVMQLVDRERVLFVEEYGCGTGWVPFAMPRSVYYLGYDRNQGCLALARQKNWNNTFVRFEQAEIRSRRPEHNDLVCAFAVLKHFPLEHMVNLFQHLFGQARCAAFTIPIAPEAHEDGTEFTHTWLSEGYLRGLLQQCGLREIGRESSLPEEPIIMAVR